MLFAVDIGNSNVVIGLWDGEQWVNTWRVNTLQRDDAQVYYEQQLQNVLLENDIRPTPRDRAVISSVVPSLTPVFKTLFDQFIAQSVVVVRPEVYPELEVKINRPNELGTDLLANAIAARHLYQTDCVIVDFGTALTFTTCTAKGEILGVAITPGLQTAIRALFQKTAQLPEVPLRLPASVMGKNTTHAIQSGVLEGYIGLVRHMIDRIRNEVGTHFIVVGTGGLSAILHPLEDDFDYINPYLTLDGLRVIDAYLLEKT